MQAAVVEVVRTCTGASGGSLRGWHAVDLLAFSYDALMSRTGLDPADLDVVIAACQTTVGEQALNVARNAVLACGWPQSIAATSVEGSTVAGVSALQYAIALVESGAANAVIVAGVGAHSRTPSGASTGVACGKPFGPKVHRRFADEGGLLPPGVVGQRLAIRFGIDRNAMDSWAELSRERARASSSSDVNKRLVVQVPLLADRASDSDPWLVSDEPAEARIDVRELKPSFEVDALVTAGNMAHPADGSAAMLVASSEFAGKRGLPCLASVGGVALQGTDVLNGDSGRDVARRLCRVPGDLEAIEIHEDFATTPLAFLHDYGVEPALVNTGGGALAFGDTGGAAAISLVGSVAHSVASGARKGLAVIAGGSGSAGAVLLEPPP